PAEPRRPRLRLDQASLQIAVGLVEVRDRTGARGRHAELALDPRATQLVADDAPRDGEIRVHVGDRREIRATGSTEGGADDGTLRGEDVAVTDVRRALRDGPRKRVRERELWVSGQLQDRIDLRPAHCGASELTAQTR